MQKTKFREMQNTRKKMKSKLKRENSNSLISGRLATSSRALAFSQSTFSHLNIACTHYYLQYLLSYNHPLSIIHHPLFTIHHSL